MSIRTAGLLALMLGVIASAAGAAPAPGVSLALAQERAALLSNIRYRLHCEIPAAREEPIAARIAVDFDLADTARGLQLDFRGSAEQIHSLRVNGAAVGVRVEREHLLLEPAVLAVGHNRVDIEFVAGDSALNRNPDYLYTLFVPDRARTAFPLFDQPDLRASWELSLVIPSDWTAVANSPVERRIPRGDQTEYRFAPTQPISSYLFAFAAGRFEAVTRQVDGRSMTLYHRETDIARVERNLDAIFSAHRNALAWMEKYTGIDYPFRKFDFVLIPAFAFGGMEHPGAIFYRAEHLLLEQAPPAPRMLGRSQLIAHETAHMWFGNLVTMRWFDDVWTKEVFAGFMADRIVNPDFATIDHDLAFLLRRVPAAYAVDRTAGANPIRQRLANLNQAGQLYGPVIYNKAPIMMRQLERITGAPEFRAGLQDYLRHFAFGNATWPELVAILDRKTEADLAAWSRIWVESAGRPTFELVPGERGGASSLWLRQSDPDGGGRVWPQQFTLRPPPIADSPPLPLRSDRRRIPLPVAAADAQRLLLNADGAGYGLFPPALGPFDAWYRLPALTRGVLLVDGYENLVEGRLGAPDEYLTRLMGIIREESDQLLLQAALWQIARIYHTLLDPHQRALFTQPLEEALWQRVVSGDDGGVKRLVFNSYSALASSPPAMARLYAIWSRQESVEGVVLEEDDFIELAEVLAIALPDRADNIIATQLKQIENPDSRRRLDFLAPSLSPDEATRDAFFQSLAVETNRHTESWVIDALSRLHHPGRVDQSRKYLTPALELLEEIQETGDIFFPSRWLEASLGNHYSAAAAGAVRAFLAARPDYSPQLRMKILQEADPLFRACRLRTDQDC